MYKRYLLLILIFASLSGIFIIKPKEKVKLDNVILKQEVNNKTFAMYKEDDDNNYVKVEDTKFPDMYVLNLTKSKCIDNNGNELDGVLSYEDDKVTITSGNTTYCYLYFDKSLGLEIKEKESKGLKTDKVRGAMYRFQGQQSDGVNNYICFGTSDKDKCTTDTDHYMYRIIGIEAETGRVKVIKKEALNEEFKWWDNFDEDIIFLDSNVYKAIIGDKFLKNKLYVPDSWEDKIDNNIWMYGDMANNDTAGARQIGEELYKIETGQKETNWKEKANENTPNAEPVVVENNGSNYYGQKLYYLNHISEKWSKTFESKVSLMYIHDYYYSVSDSANCQYDERNFDKCIIGWMHLSQNDLHAINLSEWTMSRIGFDSGVFQGFFTSYGGSISNYALNGALSARPVFYINASEELLSGTGTITDPFMIKQ